MGRYCVRCLQWAHTPTSLKTMGDQRVTASLNFVQVLAKNPRPKAAFAIKMIQG